MDGNSHYPYEVETASNEEQHGDERVSVEHLQRLIRLLDSSDVSEIEIKRAEEGMRLVLRKAKVNEIAANGEYQGTIPAPAATGGTDGISSGETKHVVTASLVGIFHTWAKPKGKALVATGDRVKIGQLLGTIQSLNVINEVESPVAGRIVEILVQDGQAVEYGQQLMIIDSSEEA